MGGKFMLLKEREKKPSGNEKGKKTPSASGLFHPFPRQKKEERVLEFASSKNTTDFCSPQEEGICAYYSLVAD